MKYTQQEQEMMQKMLLSPHFTLGEFIRSGTAIRRSIDNVPPDIIFIIRMMLLCENILEPLRKRFGAIPISSGYRCHLLNREVPSEASTNWEKPPIFPWRARRR